VEHKQNGLIIPPGSAVHLAEALGELLNSHHTRARLAANALRSLAEHDWDAYRRRLVDSLG
jgi:glycosyltransferase involved in cell wall biosynthesis